MFCRMCGKPLPSDSRFCIYCGEAVAVLVEDEPVEEKPVQKEELQYHFQPDPEFVWNVEGFPDRNVKKTEDVEFSWSKMREPKTAQVAPEPEKIESCAAVEPEKTESCAISEPAAVVEPVSAEPIMTEGPVPVSAEPEMYQTAEPEKTDSYDSPEQFAETAQPEKAAQVPAGEVVEAPAEETMEAPAEKLVKDPEEILETIKADTVVEEKQVSDQERRIDTFYTFNKKNEEFQKLLDREYEKLYQGLIDLDAPHRPAEPEQPAETEAPKYPDVKSDDISAEPAASPSITKDVPVASDTKDEELSPFDTRELNRDLMEIALAKSGLDPKNYVVEEAKQEDSQKTQRSQSRDTKSDFKPMFIVDQEDSAEEPKATDDNAAQEVPWINRNIDWEKKRVLDSLWGTIEIEGMPDPQKAQAKQEENTEQADQTRPADQIGQTSQTGRADQTSPVSQTAQAGRSGRSSRGKKLDAWYDSGLSPVESESAEAQEYTAKRAGEESSDEVGADAVSAVSGEASESGKAEAANKPKNPYLIPEIDDEEVEESGTGGFIKVLIAILAILLIAELGILGIRYFAPDTAAGEFVESKLGIATEWVQKLVPSSTDGDEQTDSEAGDSSSDGQESSDASSTDGQESSDAGSTDEQESTDADTAGDGQSTDDAAAAQ